VSRALQAILILSVLVALLAMVPVGVSSSPPQFTTTGFVTIHAGVATELGSKGVQINLRNAMQSSEFAFVIFTLRNSAGQTVLVQPIGAVFTADQNQTMFFGLSSTPSGNYMGSVFVTTGDFVPLSGTTTVQITI
jgi:hypothetical protein